MDNLTRFNQSKYNQTLHPQVGLVIEFKNKSDIPRYLNSFFGEYRKGSIFEFMEELVKAGVISTKVTDNIVNEPELTRYVLNCHKLLVLLSLHDEKLALSNLQLYSIQQVAKLLSVTRQTVYNLINAGYFTPIQLKGIKGQRISQKDLQSYLGKSQ